MNQVALIELRLAVFATELGSDLVSAVIKEQFVIPTAFVFLGLVAGEGLVGRQGSSPAKGRRAVAAVVDDAGNQWPVNVTFDEVDEDFLPDPGDVLRSPSGAGTGHGDTNPGGGVVVLVGTTVGVVLCALPVELDLDPAVLVGEDFFALRTNDGGGGHSSGSGFLVASLVVFGDDRYVAADGGDCVAIGRCVGCSVCFGCVCCRAEQSTEALLGLWRQVVLRVEAEAGDEKLAILDIVLVVDGVIL